jgi:hypothetical protein
MLITFYKLKEPGKYPFDEQGPKVGSRPLCSCDIEHGDRLCAVHTTCPWCGLATRVWPGYEGGRLKLCEKSENCQEMQTTMGR